MRPELIIFFNFDFSKHNFVLEIQFGALKNAFCTKSLHKSVGICAIDSILVYINSHVFCLRNELVILCFVASLLLDKWYKNFQLKMYLIS